MSENSNLYKRMYFSLFTNTLEVLSKIIEASQSLQQAATIIQQSHISCEEQFMQQAKDEDESEE